MNLNGSIVCKLYKPLLLFIFLYTPALSTHCNIEKRSRLWFKLGGRKISEGPVGSEGRQTYFVRFEKGVTIMCNMNEKSLLLSSQQYPCFLLRLTIYKTGIIYFG